MGQREPPGLRELLLPGALRLASPHRVLVHRLAPRHQPLRLQEPQQPGLAPLGVSRVGFPAFAGRLTRRLSGRV